MGSEASGNFGAKLRGARERKGVSLRTIATRTKISIGVLEALERNDIGRLPGGIFSRAFVRSYANEVGLDPETTIQEFMAQFPQESVTAGHPRTDQVEDTEMFESDRRVASSLLWLLLVSIPLAGGVLYLSVADKFGRAQPPAGPADRQAIAAPPAPAAAGSVPGSGRETSLPPPLAGPVASSPTAGPAAPAAASPGPPAGRVSARPPAPLPEPGRSSRESSPPMPVTSGAPATPSRPETSTAASASSAGSGRAAPGPAASGAEAGVVRTPAAGDTLMVVLSARRPVWVSATVDGQKVLGRLLQTGDQQTVEVKRELVLTAGDAAAMKMTLNGAEARVLGKTGEVVTARVTLANFKEYLLIR